MNEEIIWAPVELLPAIEERVDAALQRIVDEAMQTIRLLSIMKCNQFVKACLFEILSHRDCTASETIFILSNDRAYRLHSATHTCTTLVISYDRREAATQVLVDNHTRYFAGKSALFHDCNTTVHL